MIVQDYNISMESSQELIQRREVSSSLQTWNNNNRLAISQQQQSQRVEVQEEQDHAFLLDISRQSLESFNKAMKQAAQMTPALPATDLDSEESSLPSELQMMKMLLEKIFGIKIEITDMTEGGQQSQGETASVKASPQPSDPQPQLQNQGLNFSFSYHEIRYEKEMVQFAAQGGVTTADGRTINFNANLEMSKETFAEINIQIAGNNTQQDPLALNFDGKGVQLTGKKFDFDLDTDGENEKISFLEQGSGFLVLDKNQNGEVDNGSELFGPATDNGFLELKAYDLDDNDWIDENDAIFYQLSLWTKNAEGEDLLSSLQENNVGAIYLRNVATQFDLGAGELKETGIFLQETGGVNYIQEVDLLLE